MTMPIKSWSSYNDPDGDFMLGKTVIGDAIVDLEEFLKSSNVT